MITAVVILMVVLAFYDVWWSFKTIRKMKRRFTRIDGDINSLHQNQGVLLSTLNQIYRELRTNEREIKKNSKVIKRQIHAARPESKGSDSI